MRVHKCLRAAIDSKLIEDDRNMIPDRFLGNAETRCDCAVAQALRHQLRHLLVARAELIEQRVQLCGRRWQEAV
jgi:hypothetical protein